MKDKYIKRKQGSCRFSPYYKLEWFDSKLCVWKPRQVRYKTLEEAILRQSPDREWRVYEVNENERKLVR